MRYHGNNTKYITCVSRIRTKIKQYSLSIAIDNQKRKLICGTPTKNPIYPAWISLTNSIILELSKIHFYLFKIKRNKKKNYFKIKEKFMKVFAWKKNATSLLKTGFLVTLNLKKRWKVVELKKYLKAEVKLKLFERKLKFWNLFENWHFEN